MRELVRERWYVIEKVCVCVCVCELEFEMYEERKNPCECVCVCVCVLIMAEGFFYLLKSNLRRLPCKLIITILFLYVRSYLTGLRLHKNRASKPN